MYNDEKLITIAVATIPFLSSNSIMYFIGSISNTITLGYVCFVRGRARSSIGNFYGFTFPRRYGAGIFKQNQGGGHD